MAFFDHNVQHIPILFPQLFPDSFGHAYHIANVPTGVLQPHVHDASVIGDTVKLGVNFDPALPEYLPDVPGKDDIGPALAWNLVEKCVILKPFFRGNSLASYI